MSFALYDLNSGLDYTIDWYYNELNRKPMKSAMEEFLIYGLKYAFPAIPGPISRGMPTAQSAPPMKNLLSVNSNLEPYVWPYTLGKIRGISISPLYRSVPRAALKDNELYELLTLLDCIRIGKSREINIAKKEISTRLK